MDRYYCPPELIVQRIGSSNKTFPSNLLFFYDNDEVQGAASPSETTNGRHEGEFQPTILEHAPRLKQRDASKLEREPILIAVMNQW